MTPFLLLVRQGAKERKNESHVEYSQGEGRKCSISPSFLFAVVNEKKGKKMKKGLSLRPHSTGRQSQMLI